MKTCLMADPVRYPVMTTAELRKTFLIDALYVPGTVSQAYVDLDRAVVGMAAPWAPRSRLSRAKCCERTSLWSAGNWAR